MAQVIDAAATVDDRPIHRQPPVAAYKNVRFK